MNKITTFSYKTVRLQLKLNHFLKIINNQQEFLQNVLFFKAFADDENYDFDDALLIVFGGFG